MVVVELKEFVMAEIDKNRAEEQTQSEYYRKAVLELHQSPERLNELITVSKPTGWIALCIVVLLLSGCVIWSVLGRLPTNVAGPGILLSEGGRIYEVTAISDGALSNMAVRVGDRVEPDQLLAEITQADAEREIRGARAQLADRIADLARAISYRDEEAKLRGESITRQQQALDLRVRLGRQREETLRQRIQTTETLFRDRIVTQSEVLTLQQELAVVLQDASNANSEYARLEAEELQINNTAARRIREAEAALDEAGRRVNTLEEALEYTSRILAPVAGEVKEMRALQGARMRSGQTVLTLESRGVGIEAVIFLSPSNGSRVKVGMPVRIAPSNAPREEYGTVTGHVVSISNFPLSFEAIQASVRNEGLARSFMERGPPYEAIVRLERDTATASGYRWTSGKGVSVVLASGTTLTADVTIEFRRPIEIVIPALRDLLKL
jgi:HlyD family secretion protein